MAVMDSGPHAAGFCSRGEALPDQRLPEILVIADTEVDEVEILLAGLAPGTPVVRVEPSGGDPLQLITRGLREFRPAHVHFVCHGEPGAIRLGGARLSGESLAPTLRRVGAESICFWACGTAKGAEGREFLQLIANWSGARVHGAAGPVGNPAAGGSWELPVCAEPQVGGDGKGPQMQTRRRTPSVSSDGHYPRF